jgi:MoxR-like ATPase
MQNDIQQLLNAANQVILGKDKQIRLAVCCLLARGHLLIEDILPWIKQHRHIGV